MSLAAASVSHCTLFLLLTPERLMFLQPSCLGILLPSLPLVDLTARTPCALYTHKTGSQILLLSFRPFPQNASWYFYRIASLPISNFTCQNSNSPSACTLNLLSLLAVATITSDCLSVYPGCPSCLLAVGSWACYLSVPQFPHP